MTKSELDALFVQLQQGNEKAFDTIYMATNRALFAFLYSICHNYHTTEDMMQSTYIRFRDTISYYKPGNNALAWLYTIGKNITLNEINKRKRESMAEIEDDSPVFGSYSMDEEKVGDYLQEVMKKVLNETEIQIVTLHVISGFKHREIADIIDKPIGTVLWSYNNALAKIKKELERTGGVQS